VSRASYYLDEFWQDVIEQVRWYDAHRAGLGASFAKAVDKATDDVEARPKRFLAIGGGYRRARLRRFPHKIVFALEPEGIVFVGVVHDARDLEDWLEARKGKPG
jgi:hypothetical protein